MKEVIGMNEEGTVEITLAEYRALQQLSGRVSAFVEMIEAKESDIVFTNDVLRMLGYSDFACNREIAAQKREAEAKGIGVPKL